MWLLFSVVNAITRASLDIKVNLLKILKICDFFPFAQNSNFKKFIRNICFAPQSNTIMLDMDSSKSRIAQTHFISPAKSLFISLKNVLFY